VLNKNLTSFEKASKERKGKERGDQDKVDQDKEESEPTQPIKKKTLSQHKIRTSVQERILDSMFPVVSSARISTGGEEPSCTPLDGSSKPRDIPESDCSLTSVHTLRQAVLKGKHNRETPKC
jgi:DNA mismatch repair protein MLH1